MANTLKIGTEALASMPRHQYYTMVQNKAVVPIEHLLIMCLHLRGGLIFLYHVQGIYAGITGNIYAAILNPLTNQVLASVLRGSKAKIRYRICQPAVHLLGKWVELVFGPQASLHVADHDALIVRSQGGDEDGSRITLYQNYVRLFLLQHRFQLDQRPGSQVK